MLLINAETLAPRVANWLPKFDDILFFSGLGPIQGHKVWYLPIGNLGQIEFYFFSILALTPSVKPLGGDFNFCTNRNA
jgi:hypothetical protein